MTILTCNTKQRVV